MRQYNFTISDNDYEVIIKEVTKEDLTVDVNGEEYVVKIKDIKGLSKLTPVVEKTTANYSPKPVTASGAGQPPPVLGSESGGVEAPMPGQIIDIFVNVGDNVLKGQKVLVLEAMKLENTLTASCDGVVKKILVKDGDIVNQNQALVVIG